MGLFGKLFKSKQANSFESDDQIIAKARFMSLEEITKDNVQRVLLSRAEELCPEQSVDTGNPNVKIVRYSHLVMPKDQAEKGNDDFFIAIELVDSEK